MKLLGIKGHLVTPKRKKKCWEFHHVAVWVMYDNNEDSDTAQISHSEYSTSLCGEQHWKEN